MNDKIDAIKAFEIIAELEAKDEEIAELKRTVEGLNEMYLEVKEEIERLKADKSCEGCINWVIDYCRFDDSSPDDYVGCRRKETDHYTPKTKE